MSKLPPRDQLQNQAMLARLKEDAQLQKEAEAYYLREYRSLPGRLKQAAKDGRNCESISFTHEKIADHMLYKLCPGLWDKLVGELSAAGYVVEEFKQFGSIVGYMIRWGS